MLEQQELRTKLWTKSFIALTISALFLFMNLQMLLSSFPSYVKSEFQAGDIMVSLVTSVFALTAIASRFMTAFLMRKVSRNVLLYIGLAIAAAITGLYVVADSIGSLLLMRVGYGIGFGIASTIIPTIVSQIIPSKRMGEGIGYFGLSTSLAMSIGPMIGLNVMKHSGFGTLSMIGMITLLLAFPVLLFSRSLPAQPKKQPTPNQSESTKPLKVPFNTQLVLPAILNVMLAITYGGLLSFIALFGESVHLEQVGLFFLFNAVTIIIIRPISGRLFDKRGPASVLIPAAVCVVASLTVLSYTTSMPMLIVSALLYGLGFGAIQPTIQAWMLRTSTPAQYGMANSMFYNSTDLGVASGAIILGAISAATDYGIMYRYSAGFMVLFLIVYVGIQINKARVNPSTLSQ
ncbi:MFS transporter [Paenibacillus odorifer]|uniref:MFS transporter n=1 Tax=Paenibacillus odorifer TaxID=189426 RepID=UPI002DBB8F01|nr:MFS transporter [Paenibacillus odorifer]MEC0129587.1 MFS transporter [Paenibacillus odorifer]MEC0225255.1 MFS transporter [Paenibacillus odorifer]